MRILLHDTQNNLERFSDNVHTLTQGVEATKREINSVQKLFQHEHEAVIDKMVNLGVFVCTSSP